MDNPCPKCGRPTRVLVQQTSIVRYVCTSNLCDAPPFEVAEIEDAAPTLRMLPPDTSKDVEE